MTSLLSTLPLNDSLAITDVTGRTHPQPHPHSPHTMPPHHRSLLRRSYSAMLPSVWSLPLPSLPLVRSSAVMLLVFVTAIVGGSMVSRGKVYRSHHLTHCQPQLDEQQQRPFCGLTTLQLDLPSHLRQQTLSTLDQHVNELAVRAYVPGIRAGRTMLTHTVQHELPDVVNWYENEARQAISAALGLTVQPTALSLPTSCCLIIYDEEGDGIDWHYDVNYFTGRFFTVLVAVTTNRTCTSFVYRDAFSKDQSVELESRSVLFEGTHVFHKATPLCVGQRRVVLSLQYATDPRLTLWNRFMMFVKDRAFAGFGLGLF